MKYKQMSYSECISQANKCMAFSFKYGEKDGSVYWKVADHYAEKAAHWFQIAREIKRYNGESVKIRFTGQGFSQQFIVWGEVR